MISSGSTAATSAPMAWASPASRTLTSWPATPQLVPRPLAEAVERRAQQHDPHEAPTSHMPDQTRGPGGGYIGSGEDGGERATGERDRLVDASSRRHVPSRRSAWSSGTWAMYGSARRWRPTFAVAGSSSGRRRPRARRPPRGARGSPAIERSPRRRRRCPTGFAKTIPQVERFGLRAEHVVERSIG